MRTEIHGLEKILTRLPPELEWLTSIQSPDLSHFEQLRGKITPPGRLTSLPSLDLFNPEQLRGTLTPLAKLTCLQSLDPSQSPDFHRFALLQCLLRMLEYLCLIGSKMEDLLPENCGTRSQNVLNQVRTPLARGGLLSIAML